MSPTALEEQLLLRGGFGGRALPSDQHRPLSECSPEISFVMGVVSMSEEEKKHPHRVPGHRTDARMCL
jgi:hypothetical protein